MNMIESNREDLPILIIIKIKGIFTIYRRLLRFLAAEKLKFFGGKIKAK